MAIVAETTASQGEAIRVRGLVQGVGFRPTVWRLARDCALAGEVLNDAEGVLIRVWGEPGDREHFLYRLRTEAPPLARIDAVESVPLSDDPPRDDFLIVPSTSGEVHTGIVADAATCAACIADVHDPANRRYGYAFTNCTHCGPRLSIVERIPYDRAYTSMKAFPMCAECRREYENPADRRFHAQPNACAECGPRPWLEELGTRNLGLGASEEPIEATQRLLRDGYIVAIKGLGGIHLACDATDADAVKRLRARKHRYDKPFALMARDAEMIRRCCRLSESEEALLRSPAAPIVLLDADGPERLAEGIAPGQHYYGFMLPYTPLHHLLVDGLDAPIVLTSGNRSEEPQCIGNDEARERLGEIADAFLLHDRTIANRVDDSVVKVIAGKPALLRRARGYAPTPLRLPANFGDASPILALGGELKNTLCLLKDGAAILSQHLGDLENAAANAAWRKTLDLYLNLFEHRPRAVAIDLHPDYLSAKFGREWATAQAVELQTVQHHHAHIAACMADNGLDLDAKPVLGIALDGLGYGEDGTLWGGEFLLADYRGYRRLAAFALVAMPGGARAIREPWRMAWAHLRSAGDWNAVASEYAGLPFFQALTDKPLATLDSMVASGFNSAQTSSCGRLFDAVAALVGLRQTVSYEGQAAMELEAVVDRAALDDGKAYSFAIVKEDGLSRLESKPMWRALLSDLGGGVAIGTIAARFHIGLAHAIVRMIERLTDEEGSACNGRIALSGGVFQNAILSELLIRRLEVKGFEVLRHANVPTNDGGLSLGQAAIAAARMANGETSSCA